MKDRSKTSYNITKKLLKRIIWWLNNIIYMIYVDCKIAYQIKLSIFPPPSLFYFGHTGPPPFFPVGIYSILSASFSLDILPPSFFFGHTPPPLFLWTYSSPPLFPWIYSPLFLWTYSPPIFPLDILPPLLFWT